MASPPQPGALKVMPPHESFRDRVRRGEVKAPNFAAINRQRALAAGALQAPLSGALKAPLIGDLKALAVLVDFSDKVHTVAATFFDNLVFGAPGSGRSVRDYYNKVSYGQMDLYTVNLPSSLGWKTASESYSYYVNNGYGTDSPYPNNCQKLAEDIVDALHAQGVDFSKYDNNHDGAAEPIILIHAGSGAEFTNSTTDIWSHSWVLNHPRTYNGVTVGRYVIVPEYWQTKSTSSSDMTIGVVAHEMGHGFWDLPDLYDTTYTSNGIGDWSLMASGSWNGPLVGGYTLGGSPAWPDAYCRVQMGFVTPTTITGSQTNLSIPQAYNNPTAQTVFKLPSPFNSKEYFLLENRQKTTGTYDQYLPGSGLLIWHVDENMDSNDYACTDQTDCSCGLHYLVSLEQADGLMQLESYNYNSGDSGDSFPGATNNRDWNIATTPSSGSYYNCGDTALSVTNISNSGATMTADIGAASSQGPAISLSSASLTPSCLQGQNAASQSFQVWNSGGQTLSYTVSSGNTAWLSVTPGSGTSTGSQKTHQVTYTTAGLAVGTYQATISVIAAGASNSPQTMAVTLTVNPAAPVAGFTASPTSGYAPLPVQFTDTSTGTITGRTWDFGDGNGSTSPSPSHTYSNPGTFTAKLTVTGAGGSSSKTVTITVKKPPAPVASFTASPTSGIFPLAVQFTDTSTGNISSRVWDFGDGNGSTGQAPSHTYPNPGTYLAKLTVTGPGGSSSRTVTITVKKPPKPKVSFTASPTSGIFPLAVQFTDTSTGNITSRVWDFGDGNGSTGQAPSHIYANPATYHARLTVTGDGGSSSKTVTITVKKPPKPKVSFTASPTSGLFPLEVQFTDTSTGLIDSRVWNLGDGNGSVDQAPSNTYNLPGTYRATLTVTGPGGTSTRTVAIRVKLPPRPKVSFTAIPTSGKAALPVQFTDTSTGRIDSRAWNFGDGGSSADPSPSYTYNNPGTYTARLTVTGPGGSSSKTVTIRVTP